MAQGQNKCFFIGYLGTDSEMRYTQKGVPVTSFRMACGERYRDANGEWQEHTEWVNCVLFGKRAEGLNPYLLKRTRVSVEGSLRTRNYVSQKDGQKRWVTEVRVADVVLLGSPEGRQIRNEQLPESEGGTAESTETTEAPTPDDADAPDDFSS